jgi:hypothetical protein
MHTKMVRFSREGNTDDRTEDGHSDVHHRSRLGGVQFAGDCDDSLGAKDAVLSVAAVAVDPCLVTKHQRELLTARERDERGREEKKRGEKTRETDR